MLEDELGPGWTKTRAFGSVCFAKQEGDRLWLAIRIGNIPLGVPFRAIRGLAMIDVEVESTDAPGPSTEVVKTG